LIVPVLPSSKEVLPSFGGSVTMQLGPALTPATARVIGVSEAQAALRTGAKNEPVGRETKTST